MADGQYIINDHLVIVGSKSLRITSSASPFSISTTQSFGDLSAYSGVSSGTPTTGTVGVWVYLQANEITGITLRIGSSSGNYTEIAGVKTISDAFDVQDGWNYFVFRLKNGTTTGTPVWTAVAYARIQVASSAVPIVVMDYLTIGKGDIIGLNGLDERKTLFTIATTTF